MQSQINIHSAAPAAAGSTGSTRSVCSLAYLHLAAPVCPPTPQPRISELGYLGATARMGDEILERVAFRQ